MALRTPRLSAFRRPLLLGTLLAPLLAVACESSSRDSSPGDDLRVTSVSPDGGLAADGALLDNDIPPNTRALELARMQAHLDSLYAQSDVVHTFTTAWGDAVDCLPFQKQPGFARVASVNGSPPSLEPSYDFTKLTAYPSFGDGVDAAGNSRWCPRGSVPIRHLTLAELARFATLEDFFAKLAPPTDAVIDSQGFTHEHATWQSLVENWGAQVTLDVWQPAIERPDTSISQTWVLAGSAEQTQTVEAGYIVSARIDDEAAPRLFVYSTSDNYQGRTEAQCYDLECKAFVQLADTHILLGGRFDKVSAPNGDQRELTLRWQFCPAAECKDWEGWWLRYEGGAASEWVGFYPRNRYASPGLHDGSTRIDFGGEVAFKRGSSHTTSDMGSGQPPSGGFGVAAYQTNLQRITTGNAWAAMGPMLQGDENASCYASGPVQTTTFYPTRETPVSVQTFYFGGTGLGGACQ